MSTINTNMQSLNAQRNLAASSGTLSTSMQRLSSGLRVNSAKDDSAGLAIAERMNAQVKGMNVAIRNANDGISMAQTAEGALGKVGDALQRMRELAVQSANGTNKEEDRANLDAEFQQLGEEVNRVLKATKFNGQALFDASGGGNTDGKFAFQVGANNDENERIEVDLSTDLTDASAIQTATDGELTDVDKSRQALVDLDKAIDLVTKQRATLGAVQNRFDSVISTLQIGAENEASARGRIMDANFAVETSNLSRGQILQQAGTAMIAQANQLPQGVLSLLR